MTREELNQISQTVIICAFQVHNELGPGLLESVYETLLADKLRAGRHEVETQKPIRLVVAGRVFPKAFRVDLLVESEVVIELKSAELITKVDVKQLLTYLRLTDLRLGLVINFGRETLQIKRLVNKF